MRDRPAGDFDYERGGAGYAARRRPDPRIAAQIHAALGDAATVLNVGAGAGSYEPADRLTLAVEPSAAMRAQRPSHLAPAIDATAERLPFDDDAFDAAMATITIHQWSDPASGLRELRRVARGPVVILTFDPALFDRFWFCGYFPRLIAHEARRIQPIAEVRAGLGGTTTVAHVPVPCDCTDGFIEAYFGRPEALLDPEVRRGQSAWAFAEPDELRDGLARLRSDLADGSWDARHGHLRTAPAFDGSLRLVVGRA